MTGLASETSCPTLEDLTAFTEGRLVGEARARILRHLNRCPPCREVLAEAARLEEDLEEVEEKAESGDPASDESDSCAAVIVPFPRRIEEELANFGPPHPDRVEPPTPRVRKRRLGPGLRWAAAIAVLVLGGLGLWGHALLTPLGGMTSDDQLRAFILSLPPAKRQTLLAAVLPANRGPGEGGSLDQGLEFHYGELLADRAVACSVPVGERNQEDDRCKRAEKAIDLLLKDNPGIPTTPQEMRTLLDLQLGRWSEAARLALETGQTRYFENRGVRRFPALLLRHDRWSWLSDKLGYSLVLPPKARTALQEANVLLAEERLTAEQWKQLNEQIGEISFAYRDLSDPIEPGP